MSVAIVFIVSDVHFKPGLSCSMMARECKANNHIIRLRCGAREIVSQGTKGIDWRLARDGVSRGRFAQNLVR